MESEKVPYRAEYAKSGRAGCKSCKEAIAKDSLRLAVMVQSPFFDGMQPNWHHYSCFFRRFKPKSAADIAHFESLRWEDQENIRKKIENLQTGFDDSEKSKITKSKKRNNSEVKSVPDLVDYTLEYAKSNRSKCKVCEEFIKKDEIRISKKDYEGEIALKYGPTERWHHVDCFVKAREELGFFASAKVLPGFKTLSLEDQKILAKKISELNRSLKIDDTDGPSPPKKLKEDMKQKMKLQNETMFKYRDQLELLTKQELICLLEYNNQEVPEGVSRMLDILSDAMTFGALKKCEKCNGQLTFHSGVGYQCLGHISEWSRCHTVYEKPERVPFKVPDELKNEYSFLKKLKSKVTKRLFSQTLTSEKSLGNSDKESKKPLLFLKFFIHKTETKTPKDIKNQIETLGGSVINDFSEDVTSIISTISEVNKPKLAKVLKSARDAKICVLPETFFDEITNATPRKDFILKIEDKKISVWDSNVNDKIKEEKSTLKKSVYPSKSGTSNKSEIFKSNETVKKITLKDGLAVDPDSKLEKIAHVYRKNDDIYSVVLSLTDIQTGKNSYYKLQLLESDKKNKYWVFRAWGRIGTTIGGNKCEEYKSLNDCIHVFKDQFEDKTGNKWESRMKFKKLPGKMMMLDVQYEDEGQRKEKEKSKIPSESKILSKSIQELINLIFDVKAMTKTMLEFELDLNKMPLGKLSKKQILQAFGVLSELQNILNAECEKTLIIEKTNIFYTLVPHDCGINALPILDNEKIIQQKIDMLNSLMDIEIAYKLLKECQNSDNSIDEHYKKLNAKIIDLDSDSEEFKFIQTYVKNTHAKTHMNYTLEIQNIFKIERKEEVKRFKKFSKFPNRKLLWHGSRITNFAGILSQGLRIAPPEAPVTGYMFGKGIYFSDMVSKSANYCNTSKKNPTGLLLLCEVALGEMHELTKAENIQKLPPGKNSVKGLGKTHPDPSEVVVSPTGAEVPLGKGVKAEIKESSLLYNEYIVYDVAQVKIQYLLRLKFNYII